MSPAIGTTAEAVEAEALAARVARLEGMLAAAAPAPATCPACGAGPDVHAPSCALERAPHLERLLLRVRDELRVIDQATCSTFDGHGVRALLRLVESEVSK